MSAKARSFLLAALIAVFVAMRLVAVLLTRPYRVDWQAGTPDDYCEDYETWFTTQYAVAPTLLPPCY